MKTEILSHLLAMSRELNGTKSLPVGPLRPQSAGRRPQSAQARGLPRPHSGQIDRQALTQQCQDMKHQGNVLNMQNTHLKTRLMGVDKELSKRERLLKQLVLVNKSNQGVGMDLVLKMREERNLLPIFKQRVKDLQRELQERDASIRDKKRNPQFTRILELEIELATWQHEVQRLDNLMQDPTAENPLAKAEVEVHQQRCDQLQQEQDELQQTFKSLCAEVAELESTHDSALEEYRKKEEELSDMQEKTWKVTMAYKELFEKRKRADALEQDMEEVLEEKAKYEQEIDTLLPSKQESVDERCRVSRQVMRPKKGTVPNIQLWLRLRQAGASHPDGLLRVLQSHDGDNDGYLSMKEFAAAVGSLGLSASAKELEAACSSAFPGNSRALFWLDLLVFLDLLGTDVATAPGQSHLQQQSMPEIRELRVACMQQCVCPEEFQAVVANITSRRQAEEFFGGRLSLGNHWVVACEELGSSGLLFRIPISEVAMTESQQKAWWIRCATSVRNNQVELSDGFVLWDESGRMTEQQFQSICLDILGSDLSDLDVAFLGAFAWEGGAVSGQRVLSLAA